jgi:hypothetical protein
MRLASHAITIVLLLAVPDSIVAQHCSNITTVDFRNSTVADVRDVDEPLRFRNGVLDELATLGPSAAAAVEWRYEIVRDTTVRPDPQTAIRFIEMFKNDLAGSGSREYLVGFRCSDGVVKNVFQQHSEGMRVVSLSPDTLHLRFAVWTQKDSHASPSGSRDTWFSWNASSRTYIETHSTDPEFPADGH